VKIINTNKERRKRKPVTGGRKIGKNNTKLTEKINMEIGKEIKIQADYLEVERHNENTISGLVILCHLLWLL